MLRSDNSEFHRRATKAPRVAIIGGGFSGTLLAINLLRYSDAHILLLERDSGKLARGLAFSTGNPDHVLNVRASNMSAFPDDLDHFSRWLGDGEPTGKNRFVSRHVYGRYLTEQLEDAQAASPDRLTSICGHVIAADRGTGEANWTLILTQGDRHDCDILILAQGNMPPSLPAGLEGLDPDLYCASPWQSDLAGALDDQDTLLLVGTGLTAIDIALSLDRDGFRGAIVALSRRGLRPRAHALTGPAVSPVDRPRAMGSQLIRAMRKRAVAIGWRSAVDELRPFTQDIWRRMDLAERQRFLRHLRPYWDAHRHRLAPAVDDKIRLLEAEGRLSFAAGKIVEVSRAGDQLRIDWRVRGTDMIRSETVRRIINCTGPSGHIASSKDPLLRHLLTQGHVRQDALGLGLDVDRQGQVRDRDGRPQPDLLAVGPMTRAEGWEIVAVPDIRRQVWYLARQIGHAQWVDSEGL